jgi:hypothetical protein
MEYEVLHNSHGKPKEVCSSELPLPGQERQRLLQYLL